MAKTSSKPNPRRLPVWQTAQFWSAVAGGWLLIVGLVGGWSAEAGTDNGGNPSPKPPAVNTSLRVTNGRQQPGSVIDQLQNAGGLQRQTGAGLQQPTEGDVLQPNAKTDSLDQPAEAD